ncbi:Uncharacterised protein [Candidatus Tiddalikarchaeum anstoanum]|nr:Uncharacterised protein [Candidatus Tiddalikarchaeum anstoanum]
MSDIVKFYCKGCGGYHTIPKADLKITPETKVTTGQVLRYKTDCDSGWNILLFKRNDNLESGVPTEVEYTIPAFRIKNKEKPKAEEVEKKSDYTIETLDSILRPLNPKEYANKEFALGNDYENIHFKYRGMTGEFYIEDPKILNDKIYEGKIVFVPTSTLSPEAVNLVVSDMESLSSSYAGKVQNLYKKMKKGAPENITVNLNFAGSDSELILFNGVRERHENISKLETDTDVKSRDSLKKTIMKASLKTVGRQLILLPILSLIPGGLIVYTGYTIYSMGRNIYNLTKVGTETVPSIDGLTTSITAESSVINSDAGKLNLANLDNYMLSNDFKPVDVDGDKFTDYYVNNNDAADKVYDPFSDKRFFADGAVPQTEQANMHNTWDTLQNYESHKGTLAEQLLKVAGLNDSVKFFTDLTIGLAITVGGILITYGISYAVHVKKTGSKIMALNRKELAKFYSNSKLSLKTAELKPETDNTLSELKSVTSELTEKKNLLLTYEGRKLELDRLLSSKKEVEGKTLTLDGFINTKSKELQEYTTYLLEQEQYTKDTPAFLSLIRTAFDEVTQSENTTKDVSDEQFLEEIVIPKKDTIVSKFTFDSLSSAEGMGDVAARRKYVGDYIDYLSKINDVKGKKKKVEQDLERLNNEKAALSSSGSTVKNSSELVELTTSISNLTNEVQSLTLNQNLLNNRQSSKNNLLYKHLLNDPQLIFTKDYENLPGKNEIMNFVSEGITNGDLGRAKKELGKYCRKNNIPIV